MKYNLNIGDRFYMLQVIDKPYSKSINGKKRRVVKCKCDCGNVKEVRIEGLFDKREKDKTKSCGCQRPKINKKIAKNKRTPYTTARYLYSAYKGNAKRRGIYFNLTREDHFDIITQPCYYCQSPPKLNQPPRAANKKIGAPLAYHGIDRFDNNKGYIKENCVSCCTTCNFMKGKLDYDTFVSHIDKLYKQLYVLNKVKRAPGSRARDLY